ncbi:hypothetical protein BKA61DRAFT_707231 [Leptodontidium sp. MPI-SDFR-AT-0119]|nr:hypothetical protein BKA61DRAFT_707231 [Leptodontidium sp. MPI-SDFR-AT-0119]
MGSAGHEAVDWDSDAVRTSFSQALSEMYRQEVPLYGDLISIVKEVDDGVFEAEHPGEVLSLPLRHRVERHGAIRLGKASELSNTRRLFAIYGMHPVGYYDLSVVGFPLHATAFRPVEAASLEKNPFRVFTTLLRHDLLSPEATASAEQILAKRSLFSPRLLEMIEKFEVSGWFTSAETHELLQESLKIFKWRAIATVSLEQYKKLKQEHPTVADIVSFPSAHINHLTPRTLDIDLVQETMIARGIPAKERIEGPPRRKCQILLRQTSFKALEERVSFSDDAVSFDIGSHTARFGEVEQRGAALTRKGRQLYDELLATASAKASSKPADAHTFNHISKEVFTRFPDSWAEMYTQGLVFVRYEVTAAGFTNAESLSKQGVISVDRLLKQQHITYEPITYEDFLPVSAAGIFTSNVGVSVASIGKKHEDRSGFEQSLGASVADEMLLYQRLQAESLEECRRALKLAQILV